MRRARIFSFKCAGKARGRDRFGDSVIRCEYHEIRALPSIYGLKTRFQNLLRPVTNTLARVGVIGTQIGASRRYDGPMGKSDRALVFGALGLLLRLNLPIVPVVRYVLWFMLVLLLLSIINRARGALAEVQGSPSR